MNLSLIAGYPPGQFFQVDRVNITGIQLVKHPKQENKSYQPWKYLFTHNRLELEIDKWLVISATKSGNRKNQNSIEKPPGD